MEIIALILSIIALLVNVIWLLGYHWLSSRHKDITKELRLKQIDFHQLKRDQEELKLNKELDMIISGYKKQENKNYVDLTDEVIVFDLKSKGK